MQQLKNSVFLSIAQNLFTDKLGKVLSRIASLRLLLGLRGPSWEEGKGKNQGVKWLNAEHEKKTWLTRGYIEDPFRTNIQ